ncbi:MAG: hypothetical protein LBS82_03310 [Spirochaetaceae bacterium]|jgi:hypothetical protein|nr:hypothetical protein [Spirochaetaceae bacterium]
MNGEETRNADEAKITEKDVLFYYNREARLAKASPRVRALYEDAPKKRFGLFSSLTDSKPKAALLGAILVICLVILFLTYVAPDAGASIAGNKVSVRAMRFNGASFMVLTKVAARGAYTGVVTVTVSPLSGGAGAGRSFTHSVVFTEAKSEEARWSAPLESEELLISLAAGADVGSFRVKTD